MYSGVRVYGGVHQCARRLTGVEPGFLAFESLSQLHQVASALPLATQTQNSCVYVCSEVPNASAQRGFSDIYSSPSFYQKDLHLMKTSVDFARGGGGAFSSCNQHPAPAPHVDDSDSRGSAADKIVRRARKQLHAFGAAQGKSLETSPEYLTLSRVTTAFMPSRHSNSPRAQGCPARGRSTIRQPSFATRSWHVTRCSRRKRQRVFCFPRTPRERCVAA